MTQGKLGWGRATVLHSGCSEGIVTEGFTEEEAFPLGFKGWGILGHVDELEKASGLRAGCSAYPELGKSVRGCKLTGEVAP